MLYAYTFGGSSYQNDFFAWSPSSQAEIAGIGGPRVVATWCASPTSYQPAAAGNGNGSFPNGDTITEDLNYSPSTGTRTSRIGDPNGRSLTGYWFAGDLSPRPPGKDARRAGVRCVMPIARTAPRTRRAETGARSLTGSACLRPRNPAPASPAGRVVLSLGNRTAASRGERAQAPCRHHGDRASVADCVARRRAGSRRGCGLPRPNGGSIIGRMGDTAGVSAFMTLGSTPLGQGDGLAERPEAAADTARHARPDLERAGRARDTRGTGSAARALLPAPGPQAATGTAGHGRRLHHDRALILRAPQVADYSGRGGVVQPGGGVPHPAWPMVVTDVPAERGAARRGRRRSPYRGSWPQLSSAAFWPLAVVKMVRSWRFPGDRFLIRRRPHGARILPECARERLPFARGHGRAGAPERPPRRTPGALGIGISSNAGRPPGPPGRRGGSGRLEVGGQCGGQAGEEDVEAAFEFGGAVVGGQVGGEAAQQGEFGEGQPVQAEP